MVASEPSKLKSILIVEDHELARRALAVALKKTNFFVLQAADGIKALQIAKTHRPSVILLDIVLPGSLNGFQVCEEIKKSPLLDQIFVILTSGLKDSKEFAEAKRVRANAYLVKPFRLSRLFDILINHEQYTGKFLLDEGA